MHRFKAVLEAAYGTPWAILPEKGAAVAQILRRIEAGGRPDAETVAAAMAAKKAKPVEKPRGFKGPKARDGGKKGGGTRGGTPRKVGGG